MPHLEQSMYEHYMKVYKNGQTLWTWYGDKKHQVHHISAEDSKFIARNWLIAHGYLN